MLDRLHANYDGPHHLPKGQMIEVLFVGGPLHGVCAMMAETKPRIIVEANPNQQVVYVRSRGERTLRNGRRSATYVRSGIAPDETPPLTDDARKHGPWI